MKQALQAFKKNSFLTRLGFLAVAVALFCYKPIATIIIKEHDQIEQKAKLVSISYYYPYFPYFADIVIGSEQPKKEWMDTYYLGRPYIFNLYYQKVAEMFPQNDAAHYLLGYCAYYSGDRNLARVQFERSIEINPYFFWSYYDLGVVYFQQGDLLKSAAALSHALSLNKEFTLEILHQGPFYRQIWQHIADPAKIAESNLNSGRQAAVVLWEYLHKKTKNRQQAPDVTDRLMQEQIPVRLF